MNIEQHPLRSYQQQQHLADHDLLLFTATPTTTTTTTTTTTPTTTPTKNSLQQQPPGSPAQSVASYTSSSVHPSNLALINPPNSLASLSLTLSSPSQQQQPQQQQQPSHPILSHSTPQAATTLLQQSDPSINVNPNPSHLHNRSIPPPLTLLSSLPKSEDPSTTHSDDLMTARCSQFPVDALEPRHPTISGSCRFQPYLPTLPTDPSAWSSDAESQPINPTRSIFHPSQQLSPSQFTSALDDSSLSSNDLHSSCSSLASSTKSSQSSSYFPAANLPFRDSSSTSAAVRNTGDVLFPPLAPPGFSQNAVYPAYTGPPSRTSLGLAYPTAAFTPSGGSPPIASASSAYFHFDSAGAGRRHTVSAYASPMPIELGLVSNPEFDENLVKEEKRRRNKESSQRFRDRTRERQREKQERLEYLERRTKELENQLKAKSHGDEMQDDSKPQAASTEREMNEKLWAENETLRSLLKKATEEINRLQQLTGTQSPHSPLNVGQFYATLAQLSPAASTDLTPGSQSSSPATEHSYFARFPRDTSPASEKAASTQRLGQTPVAQNNTYSPAERCAQLEQLSFHHTHQPPVKNAPNDFWDCTQEPGNLATGWQPTDH